MNLLDSLPAWPRPIRDEAPTSWLRRARTVCGLNPKIWQCVVGDEQIEPERGRFWNGSRWSGFPAGVGDIAGVPFRWRTVPTLRTMHCRVCSEQAPGASLPQLISFFDARRFVCPAHSVWLSYGDHGGATIDGSLKGLLSWLDGWIRGEISPSGELIRHDLVMLFARNWQVMTAPCEAAYHTWSLPPGCPSLPEYRRRWPMHRPGRLGDLSPAERLTAVVMANRCWLALLRGREWPVDVPRCGKYWFDRRWPSWRLNRALVAG